MACQLLDCCQFFKSLGNFPKTAVFIQEKLCHGDFESCSRFRFFKGYTGEDPVGCFDPGDEEAVKNAIRCMQKKQQAGE